MTRTVNIDHRRANREDLEEIQELFRVSINGLTMNHYTEAQRGVWRSGANDSTKWLRRISQQYFLLAQVAGRLAGMASLEGDYIDVLYVHPDFAGQSVAYHLYMKLVDEAAQTGAEKLITDASHVARSFFERQGFRVVRKNKNQKDGEVLVNFRMEKIL